MNEMWRRGTSKNIVDIRFWWTEMLHETLTCGEVVATFACDGEVPSRYLLPKILVEIEGGLPVQYIYGLHEILTWGSIVFKCEHKCMCFI